MLVRLTDEERETLHGVVKKLKGSSLKVKRAQILLKADADGPRWMDRKIAEAFSCWTQTVAEIRQRLVTEGFETVLNGVKRNQPPRQKLLDGEQEAIPADQARSLVRRLEFRYTPKHGGWLNIAENELSSVTRQCLNGRRIGDIETLRKQPPGTSPTTTNNAESIGNFKSTTPD